MMDEILWSFILWFESSIVPSFYIPTDIPGETLRKDLL